MRRCTDEREDGASALGRSPFLLVMCQASELFRITLKRNGCAPVALRSSSGPAIEFHWLIRRRPGAVNGEEFESASLASYCRDFAVVATGGRVFVLPDRREQTMMKAVADGSCFKIYGGQYRSS